MSCFICDSSNEEENLTGLVLQQKNSEQKLPPNSLAKLCNKHQIEFQEKLKIIGLAMVSIG